MRKQLVLGAMALLLSAGVYAEGDGDGRDDRQLFLAAGATLAMEQSLYLDGDDGVELLPLWYVQLGPVFLRGPAIGSYLYAGDGLTVSAAISLDLRDTSRGDSRRLSNMVELDQAVLGELEVSREVAWGELGFSFAADISGTHDGYLVGLSYGYPVAVGRWEIEPQVGIEWQSAGVTRYYYGVSAADVLPTRPLYESGAGVNYELGVTLTYLLAERHSLQLETRAELLSSEVSDSPIVERDNRVNISVGYLFRY